MDNQRVCYIEVQTGSTVMKRLNGLAIKGRVSRKMGSLFSQARISVANLSADDVEFLTTYTSPYINVNTLKKINIYAGYENTGYGRIFTGDIYKALPNGMPDTWLNIEAKSLYYNQRTPLSYGVANVTTSTIAQSIANQLDLTLDWEATEDKTVDSFSFAGSEAELIKEFNQLTDALAYEDNGLLKVVDKVAKTTGRSVKLISKDTGMIGLPEPDQFGIRVRCLLDPSLYCGDWIKVESVKIPSINGYYQIYTLDFDFASRETAFYCDIYARRTGV